MPLFRCQKQPHTVESVFGVGVHILIDRKQFKPNGLGFTRTPKYPSWVSFPSSA